MVCCLRVITELGLEGSELGFRVYGLGCCEFREAFIILYGPGYALLADEGKFTLRRRSQS